MPDENNVPFVDLKAQYAAIEPAVRAAIDDVLTRADFILGRSVDAFEAEFAAYVGTRFAVGVDSGLSALELALRAMDVGEGDEVITAANTFIASALAITSTGAAPVLVDPDPDTHNLDVEQLERALTPRTKVIMPVHLYGRVADMAPILELAERHGLKVLEDACQAHGARYRGRRAGSLGHAAAFSFYPAKNLGAYGDGGALTTDDPVISERVRLLRNYGSKVKYQHEVAGMNRRLDTLQAAVLLTKLPLLDGWNEARSRHAARYRELLDPDAVKLPDMGAPGEHVFHLYVVRSRQRDALQAHLAEAGVATGIHYPVPIHLQPAYAGLGLGPGSFPVTERLTREILSLPLFPELSAAQIERVASAVNELVPAGAPAAAV